MSNNQGVWAYPDWALGYHVAPLVTPRRCGFALLQGQLLAGEISRSAFLDRASLTFRGGRGCR